MQPKEFEISIGWKDYKGEYHYEGNELMIDECNRWTCDERNIETITEIDSINNKEEFSKVYAALEKDTCDEKADAEEYKRELRYSIAEDRADEKRKN